MCELVELWLPLTTLTRYCATLCNARARHRVSSLQHVTLTHPQLTKQISETQQERQKCFRSGSLSVYAKAERVERGHGESFLFFFSCLLFPIFFYISYAHIMAGTYVPSAKPEMFPV